MVKSGFIKYYQNFYKEKGRLLNDREAKEEVENFLNMIMTILESDSELLFREFMYFRIKRNKYFSGRLLFNGKERKLKFPFLIHTTFTDNFKKRINKNREGR